MKSSGVVIFAVLFSLIATAFAPLAAADDWDPYYNEDEYTAFYTPPNPLPPGQPGDLVRSEPSRLILEPSGVVGNYNATGTRIMYRSTDARGNPDVVTGTYFEPFNAWPGRGPRPLIVYGPSQMNISNPTPAAGLAFNLSFAGLGLGPSDEWYLSNSVDCFAPQSVPWLAEQGPNGVMPWYFGPNLTVVEIRPTQGVNDAWICYRTPYGNLVPFHIGRIAGANAALAAKQQKAQSLQALTATEMKANHVIA